MIACLRAELEGFDVVGSEAVLDDFVSRCRYAGGEFEISDDWGGLFIIPRANHSSVVEDLAAALVRSGSFERIDGRVGRSV